MNKKVIFLIIGILLFHSISSFSVTRINNETSIHKKNITPTDNEIINTVSEPSEVILDSWPMAGHDNAQTSFSDISSPSEADVIWQRDDLHFQSGVDCAPVVDGKIYVGTADQQILCLDADTGEVLDSTYLSGSSGVSIYAVADGKIYGRDSSTYGPSVFFCYDAETLEKIWDDDNFYGNIIRVIDNVLYCGGAYGIKLYNASDGSVLPSNFGPVLAYWALAIENGYLYTKNFYFDMGITCRHASNGSEIWNYSTSTDEYLPITVSDGRMFCAGNDGLFYCFDAVPSDDGVDEGLVDPVDSIYDLIWTFPIPVISNNNGEIGVGNGMVYFSTKPNTLYCLDAEGNGDGTTNEIWNATDIFLDEQFIVTGDNLYASIFETSYPPRTYLRCFDAFTGDVIFNFNTSIPTPPYRKNVYPTSVSDGKFFIITESGHNSWLMRCIRDNGEPEVPVAPDGPSVGIVDMEYMFCIDGAVDPDGDQVYYMWDFGDEQTGWEGPYDSGEEVCVTHSWPIVGTYEVKVKVKDQFDYINETWSDSHIIDIVSPELEITAITGGVFKVDVEITNTGELEVNDIDVSILVKGGIFNLIDVNAGDTIDSLAPGEIAIVTASPIFGLGSITITAETSSPDLEDPVIRVENGKVFFVIVTVDE